jgi:hypothetical protein
MSNEPDYIWQGRDREGIDSRIAREQWESHVAKRKEIEPALDLTIRTMIAPETVEPDRQRPDEAKRYFRLLTASADELRPGYRLKVSVKYVLQTLGEWVKFFQSCWFERKR